MVTNAISSVTVTNMVTDGAGKSFPATFTRQTAPKDLVRVFPLESDPTARELDNVFRPNGAPLRPPSTLPPPGNLHLTCRLGSDIGSGRSGIVFEVLDPVLDAALPPLVVKVCRQSRCLSMGREAWFYDELEILQGVVVPRCYGWFELQLQDGWNVPCWTTHFGPGADSSDGDADAFPIEYIATLGTDAWEHEPRPHPMALQLAAERQRVYILLLERAGPCIADSGPPPSLQQLDDAFGELADLGVTIDPDVREDNILWAPESPPGLPSLPSPYTGIMHALRIIDFGYAYKTDRKKWRMMVDNRSWYRSMARVE